MNLEAVNHKNLAVYNLNTLYGLNSSLNTITTQIKKRNTIII